MGVRFLIVLIVFSTASCSRDDARTTVQLCHDRLTSRTQLSEEQTNQFCACFVSAAEEKVGKEEIRDAFISGTTDEFKQSLIGEKMACQAQTGMTPTPH